MKKKIKWISYIIFPTLLISSAISTVVALSSCGVTSSIINDYEINQNNSEQNIAKNTNSFVDNVSVSSLKVGTFTQSDFFNFYSKNENNKALKKIINEQLRNIVKGPINQIGDNFKCKLINDGSKVYLQIDIFSGFWYKDNSIKYDAHLIGKVLIVGFATITNNHEGGTFNSLNIDKNLKLVDILLSNLNINNKFNISNLTNSILNDVYKRSQKHNQLNCEISNESNTKMGKLVLNVSGSFANKQYNNEKITILGFNKITSINNVFVSEIKLNTDNWFKDLKPTKEVEFNKIKDISSNDFLNKYIESGYLSNLDNTGNRINHLTIKEALNYGYNIKFQSAILNNKNNQNVDFKLFLESVTYQTKKYQNNTWINDELINIPIANSPIYSDILAPTNDDALKFLLKTTTINPNILEKYYPSYFKAQALDAEKNNNIYPNIGNFVQNQHLSWINQHYFVNKKLTLAPISEYNSFIANDWTGELYFPIGIGFGNNAAKFKKTIGFKNEKKKLSAIFESKIKTAKNQYIVNPDSADRVLRLFKKGNQDIIDNGFKLPNFTEQEFELNTIIPISMFNLLNNTAIYHGPNNINDTFDVNKPNLQNLLNSGNITILGQSLEYVDKQGDVDSPKWSGELNINNGLFKMDDDNTFFIQSLRFNVAQMLSKIAISKGHSDLINIEIPAKLHLSFASQDGINDTKDVELDAIISISVLRSHWDQLK